MNGTAKRYGLDVNGSGARPERGLETAVLSILCERGSLPTYVIANSINMDLGWQRPPTGQVLRVCRRHPQDEGRDMIDVIVFGTRVHLKEPT
jgi:hypothetical protein